MKIKWLGHSAFLLEESTGTRVVCDPYDGKIIGYDMPKVSAEIVTVSHGHADHNNTVAVGGNPTILNRVGAYEAMGIHITSIKSYHDDRNGSLRSDNIIFKYRIDGVEICHLGDIGEECSIELSEAIGSCDILMIPVGGNFTIDAVTAKEYVDLLMPDIVIPMHFKTKECEVDIDKIDDFLDEFEDEQLVYIDGDEVEYDRADFEHEDTKVIVFK